MCMFVCPKNSSQKMNGSESKFAHVILCAIRRSTVFNNFQFSTFKFSNFHLFLNRMSSLNSRATGSTEHCAHGLMYKTSPLAMAARIAGAPP